MTSTARVAAASQTQGLQREWPHHIALPAEKVRSGSDLLRLMVERN
jgi:hypothetical protein